MGSTATVGLQQAMGILFREPRSRPPAQQPLQLLPIQPVPAHHRAIQEQHGNVKAVAPRQHRVAIHVDDIDGRQRELAPERGELREHLIAQVAALAVDDGQPRGAAALRRVGARQGSYQCRESTGVTGGGCPARTELAM